MQKLITRLALTNLKKNKEIYIPYMISGVLACAFYYIFTTLSMNPEIEGLYGGKTIGETLRLGGRIIALAAGVIVLYANSFTMKRRMVEMGLYSVLGLEKRHIGRMVAVENLLVGCTVMVTGLVTGMLLDKLSYAVLLRVMRFPVTLNSFFSVRAVGKTGIVFGLIFLAVILVNCWKIMRYNPLALMKEKRSGEKEVRFLWLGTLLGVLMLGAAYTIAVRVENPVKALTLFFGAVLLASGGTFFIFRSGSIMLFRLLQKNKSYYYKPQNFISVSNLIFRIRKNAAGMASICLLCSMALVSLIGGISLYKGGREYLNAVAAKPYVVDISRGEKEVEASQKTVQELWETEDGILADIEEKYGLSQKGARNYRYVLLPLQEEQSPYKVNQPTQGIEIPKAYLTVIDQSAYKSMTGKSENLKEMEVLLYDPSGSSEEKQVTLEGQTYQIKEQLDTDIISGNISREMSNLVNNQKVMVVSDLKKFEEVQETLKEKENISWHHFYSWETKNKQEKDFRAKVEAELQTYPELQGISSVSITDRHYDELEYYQLIGGIVFIGGFLALLFLSAMVLVIYYKQYAEAHEDCERFAILQKVGLDGKDINKTIARQVLTVFFMPITLAIIHMIFAYNIVQQILQLLGVINKRLMLGVSVGTSVVMVAFYGAVYLMTAKVYKNIVTRR